MRILAISDKRSEALWEFFDKSRLKDIDLILSCGDLPAEYLSFLATMAHAPLLYVRGNHDDSFEQTPPEGCICIEDDLYVYRGLRILGLGGSPRYRSGKNQYSQREMFQRVRRMWLKLWYHKGCDVMLTHAPAYGINDGDDPVHTGFHAFVKLMEKYSVNYLVHGHVHLNYGRDSQRVRKHGATTIINAYEQYIFDTEE